MNFTVIGRWQVLVRWTFFWINVHGMAHVQSIPPVVQQRRYFVSFAWTGKMTIVCKIILSMVRRSVTAISLGAWKNHPLFSSLDQRSSSTCVPWFNYHFYLRGLLATRRSFDQSVEHPRWDSRRFRLCYIVQSDRNSGARGCSIVQSFARKLWKRNGIKPSIDSITSSWGCQSDRTTCSISFSTNKWKIITNVYDANTSWFSSDYLFEFILDGISTSTSGTVTWSVFFGYSHEFVIVYL